MTSTPDSDSRTPPDDSSVSPHLPIILRAALESAGEAVVVTDLTGSIVYANPAFARITGWSIEEALGQNPRILQSGLESRELYTEMWQSIASGRTWSGSFRNRRRDGVIYQVEQTIAPVRDDPGDIIGYVSVHEDVTERVELERRLRAETKEKLRLLQQEAAQARTVQQRLYPRSAPQLEGFDIAGRAVPATALCGDYFDFVSLPDGHLAVIVGDVCGHGIGPALVMSETRAWLRSLLNQGLPSNEVLSRVNEAICPDMVPGMFVTLFVSIINPRTREACVAGAGHRAYVVRADGSSETLDSTGPVAGLISGAAYGPGVDLTLSRGDTLLLATDGLVESQSASRELFGITRVLDTVRSHSESSSAELVDTLHEAALQFTGRDAPEDDITIVAVRCQ